MDDNVDKASVDEKKRTEDRRKQQHPDVEQHQHEELHQQQQQIPASKVGMKSHVASLTTSHSHSHSHTHGRMADQTKEGKAKSKSPMPDHGRASVCAPNKETALEASSQQASKMFDSAPSAHYLGLGTHIYHRQSDGAPVEINNNDENPASPKAASAVAGSSSLEAQSHSRPRSRSKLQTTTTTTHSPRSQSPISTPSPTHQSLDQGLRKGQQKEGHSHSSGSKRLTRQQARLLKEPFLASYFSREKNIGSSHMISVPSDTNKSNATHVQQQQTQLQDNAIEILTPTLTTLATNTTTLNQASAAAAANENQLTLPAQAQEAHSPKIAAQKRQQRARNHPTTLPSAAASSPNLPSSPLNSAANAAQRKLAQNSAASIASTTASNSNVTPMSQRFSNVRILATKSPATTAALASKALLNLNSNSSNIITNSTTQKNFANLSQHQSHSSLRQHSKRHQQQQHQKTNTTSNLSSLSNLLGPPTVHDETLSSQLASSTSTDNYSTTTQHLAKHHHHHQQRHQANKSPHKTISPVNYTSSRNLINHSDNNSSSNFNNMADQAVIDKLEAGFAKLQAATPEQCHSLLKKYLTREVLDKLKSKKTAMNASLLDVVQSGFENLDSGVGIYAPDAESYTLFAALFNPIIEDYHGGFKATDKHPASDFGDLETLVNVDPNNEFVISTRVRCGRSLQGYPFNPCLTEAQYKEMEQKVSSTLKEMEGDHAGTYYPLTGMTKETQQQLIDDHFLFKEGDRFLQAANACRYWPTGRGIYHNAAKTFLVWVNEEDHLRIISMQKGGDLKAVFGRLVKGAKAIEAKVPFSRDDRLGFLTFCPTNLGTTIRASVHIKLPKLAADRKKLEEVAGRYNLQVRGTSGEHTESVGGVYDISNKRRLGLTEYQAVREMQDGILELIKIEKSL